MDYSATAFLRYLSLRTVMHELLPNYWGRFNVYRSNRSSHCRDCIPPAALLASYTFAIPVSFW